MGKNILLTYKRLWDSKSILSFRTQNFLASPKNVFIEIICNRDEYISTRLPTDTDQHILHHFPFNPPTDTLVK